MYIYIYISLVQTYTQTWIHTILKYLGKDLEEIITALPLGRGHRTLWVWGIGRHYLLYVFLYFQKKCVCVLLPGTHQYGYFYWSKIYHKHTAWYIFTHWCNQSTTLRAPLKLFLWPILTIIPRNYPYNFLRLYFFRTVWSSVHNWRKGREMCHLPLDPAHAEPLPLSTPPTRGVHLL